MGGGYRAENGGEGGEGQGQPVLPPRSQVFSAVSSQPIPTHISRFFSSVSHAAPHVLSIGLSGDAASFSAHVATDKTRFNATCNLEWQGTYLRNPAFVRKTSCVRTLKRNHANASESLEGGWSAENECRPEVIVGLVNQSQKVVRFLAPHRP